MEQRSMEQEWLEMFPNERAFQTWYGTGHRNWRMDRLLRTLLGLATSQRDLERLHSLLPGYCQLPREKLVELKRFWERWFSRDAPTPTRISSKKVKWILTPFWFNATFFQMYISILETRKQENVPAKHIKFGLDDDFTLSICGITSEYRCSSLSITDDHRIIKVYARFSVVHLTEAKTHSLMSLPAGITFTSCEDRFIRVQIPLEIKESEVERLVTLDPLGGYDNYARPDLPHWLQDNLSKISPEISCHLVGNVG